MHSEMVVENHTVKAFPPAYKYKRDIKIECIIYYNYSILVIWGENHAFDICDIMMFVYLIGFICLSNLISSIWVFIPCLSP